MGIIDIKNLVFEYIRRDEEGNTEEIERAIDGVKLEVNEGDFIAILGHNGSGKSTLAKHLNALLVPTEGTVWVNGFDTRDVANLLNIRQSAGMVFQNPDNQIIASVVEEDVGFGPENMGVPTDEILRTIIKNAKHHVIAEGNINTPEKAKRVIELGAFSVVVGSIITRPQLITKSFAEALTAIK